VSAHSQSPVRRFIVHPHGAEARTVNGHSASPEARPIMRRLFE
jgi:hypothetical protein